MTPGNQPTLLDAVLDSWDRSNVALINLLRAIPPGGLDARAMAGSPTVAEMFTHMHHERMVSVLENVPESAVVVPDAPLKVYLTASEQIRAYRRGAQDRKAGRDGDFDTVLADVRRRDELDSTRHTSPLHVAADALVIDTDDLSVDAVLAELLRLVKERGLVR